MSAWKWALLCAWACLALLVVWMVTGSRGATCQERGGRQVFTGFMTINNMVGKVMVPTLVPQYRCEGGN